MDDIRVTEKRITVPERKHIVIAIVLAAAVIAVSLLWAIYTCCRVTEVTVSGNQHYTVEQIQDIVMKGRLGHNSIYLYLKYHNKSVDNIPFVQTMDVDVLSPTSISITVYEKAIAGCVGYLDRYMYFDKDGIVVETSKVRQKDLPYVTGLSFDYVVLYEKLPVGDESVFETILNITQLLSKYNIITDQIYFDSNDELTLFFGNAKVKMGTLDSIDEKMIKLQGIIPKLEGLDGVLYLDNYSEDAQDNYITFQREDVRQHEVVNDYSEEESSDETAEETAAEGE